MDDTTRNERHDSNDRGHKHDSPKKSWALTEVSPQILLWILNGILFIIISFILWQFSIQFEKFFNKYIKPTHTTIEHNAKTTEIQLEILRRDIERNEAVDARQQTQIDALNYERGRK